MAEGVTEGVNGFLAEPFSEKSLASKIQEILDRPDQSVAMGLAGAKKVKEKHNRELWLQRIRQIFFMSSLHRGIGKFCVLKGPVLISRSETPPFPERNSSVWIRPPETARNLPALVGTCP